VKRIRVNSGQLNLVSDDEITLDDIRNLAQRAIEAKVPANAEVTYVTVNYRPAASYATGKRSHSTWEMVVAWRMPQPEIAAEITVDE
jgi:hypothetical protein